MYFNLMAQETLELHNMSGIFLMYGNKRLGYLEFKVHSSRIVLEYPHIERSLLHSDFFMEFCKNYFSRRAYPDQNEIVIYVHESLKDQFGGLIHDAKSNDGRICSKLYGNPIFDGVLQYTGSIYDIYEDTLSKNWRFKWRQFRENGYKEPHAINIRRAILRHEEDQFRQELCQLLRNYEASLENEIESYEKCNMNGFRERMKKLGLEFLAPGLLLCEIRHLEKFSKMAHWTACFM
ncbi:hypothetical protein DdX_17849 [Ditylenchus destructor]|uniref:Uncharacterized protein n=1 Tax=Ditylenchus destructor TaxID=166010 RepID=A0AAD4MLQ6_9BILA|nr:hypothetical protein DdX_17849 [Ditylenchus destructor]